MKEDRSKMPTNIFELEESAIERKSLYEKIINFSEEFIHTIEEQKAYHFDTNEIAEYDSFFDIDKKKNSIEDILVFFKERVLNTGLNAASGGHLGYIPGGGIYTSALGDYLAAITNRYAGVFYASPGAVRMEDALINWAGRLIGYENNYGGNLTSGGSMANLIALHTAKHHKKITNSNVTKHVIYCTSQTHHSIYKAFKVIGLDACVIRNIPLDSKFRISIQDLKTQIKHDKHIGLIPFLIIANAGSTDVGAVDPLIKLSVIAKSHNLWFHVDAAYGGFFILTALGKDKLKGIELADSVIMDPHKGLFMPYGLGIVLVKNIKYLAEAHSYDANYMRDAKNENQYSPADLSPELSKHFRGLRMWLPLKLYGETVFSDYLNEKIQLAYYLFQELSLIGYKTLCEPDLSVVAFRLELKAYDSDVLNKIILDYIQQDGRIFISSTILNNKLTLRAAILSFRTHKAEIDLLLHLLKKIKTHLDV
ncbi:pyridoxal phosphate-dependent decarboxylase family protein [Algibacter pacificus]|uniref:pyridoxal phosphate-dependent decarboxylase family protein n=1 Tax=Algibacter pacificus TaxID=2599389 RepID=UPI0011C91B22|nr:aminotransferase class V-fold PLP-dependent enzyme [Algibacter pacificus]